MSQTIAHNLSAKIRSDDILIKENYNFDSLLLSNSISEGLKEAGFLKPSPIQLKAIPLGRCGLDLIVKAKSGTGKTAVFTIIALEMINTSKNALQVLIFAPTREIAVQICDVIQTIGKGIKGLHVSSFIGGLPLENDVENAKGCHIAVGAPGRLKHLVEKGHLNTDSVRLLVFDEVDKLMEECFKNHINYIYHKLPQRKQVVALSATYQDELHRFLERYMVSPTFVTPEVDNSILLGLRQFVTVVKPSSNVVQLLKTKTEELVCLLSKISFTQCLVFCNFQQRTESISNLLNHKGWNSTHISAAQSQVERLKSYDSLKKFQCRILLSTDLTARGIDASNVDVVINYDVPYEAATYLHRMGRAGRYGSRGLCITIAADGKELKMLQGILGAIGGPELSIAKLPSGEELVADIWECDMNSFETILGDVEGPEDVQNKNVTLKKSVLELKNIRNKREAKNRSKQEADLVSTDLKKLSMDDNTENKEESEMKNVENTEKFKVEKAENNDEFEVENIKKLLDSRQQSKKMSAKYSEIDSESLLKSLALGKSFEVEKDESEATTSGSINSILKSLAANSKVVEIGKESEEEIINPALMYPWVPVEVPVLSKPSNAKNLLESDDSHPSDDENFKNSNADNKKRKRKQCSKLKSTSSQHADTEKELKKKFIVSKNTALFNITKLLTNSDFNEDVSYAISSLKNYLNLIQENDLNTSRQMHSYFSDSTNNDLLENIVNHIERWQQAREEMDPEENIFKLAHDFQLLGGPHWTVALGDKYVEEESEDEQEMEVDEEEEEEIYENIPDQYTATTSQNVASNMQNLSKRRAVNKHDSFSNVECTNSAPLDSVSSYLNTNSLQNQTFSSYFEYYSRVLANDALTFEDVPSFGSWFNQWQLQVASVRDYVQQNIYLQEMNNYQGQNSYHGYSYGNQYN